MCVKDYLRVRKKEAGRKEGDRDDNERDTENHKKVCECLHKCKTDRQRKKEMKGERQLKWRDRRGKKRDNLEER